MALRFVFRLERLLELRRLRERMALEAVARAQEAVEAQRRTVHALIRQEEEAKTELRGLQEGPLDVRRLSLAGEGLRALAQRLAREQGVLQERVKTEIEKRRRLLEARKGVRVLERFRERQERLHRREEDRREQSLLDEAGLQLSKEALP